MSQKLTTAEQLDILRKSGSHYVVHFSASWCGPCKSIQGEVTQRVLESKIPYLYLDLDEESELADEFAVTAVPTFLRCAGEVVVSRFSGANMEAFDATIAEVKVANKPSEGIVVESAAQLPRAPRS